jgi:hypothetical protein
MKKTGKVGLLHGRVTVINAQDDEKVTGLIR